jgi:flavin reductase (DIM6/NTAB) family NADH-FMN oxidoreductase RutF
MHDNPQDKTDQSRPVSPATDLDLDLDLKAAEFTFQGLRQIPVAVTTTYGGRANGLMSLSGASAGILPEAPRVTVSITKYNFSHDLILNGGVFAMHVLGNDPDLLPTSLAILMALGGSSGRDGDKLAGLEVKQGLTGSPILLGALSYVEARVTGSLDNDENTIFVGDVVAAERLHKGRKLDIGEAWGKLPHEWIEQYEANHEPQMDHCRMMRGLVPTAGTS